MKAHSLLLFLLALRALGATHYISAIGSDSNAGTGKTTSWLHAPGMANCTGNCASYTPVAGDQIIFRGGDTWHFGAATSPSVGSGGWTHTWSGTSGSPIYIGVDQTWFADGSWVRPILNGDNPLNPRPGVVNSQVAACAHPGSINININANWVTFDNFEFTGFCWNSNTFGANTMLSEVATATPNGFLVTNNYVHGWTNTAVGQAEGGTWLHAANNNGGTTMEFNVIDGSDSDPATLNYDVGNLTTMAYNVIRYNQGQNSTSGCYRVHDNLFEHMDNVADGSGAHSDVLQCYGETGNGAGDPNLFYNNIFRNIPDSGAPMSTNAIWFFPPTGQTDYAFNNVSEDVGNGGGPDNWMFNQTGGPGGGNLKLFNNTFVVITASGVVRNDLGGGGTVTAANNHYMVTPATQGNVYVNSITETNAVYQTNATATTQGYVPGNNYAPTAGTNATVGAGGNQTSFCSGLVDTLAKSSCLSGTTNGCTYVTATHSVSCPMLAANARPSSGAWDAGAYQFSGSGSLLPPTFSPPGASYGPAQTVTISLPAGSTGCYTTDGSTPAATTAGTCSHGTTYSTAITVSTSQTVQALATEVGFTNSAVANAVYVINGALATPTIAPPTGTYAGPQSATITGPAGSTLWYNFTGTFTGCTASSCPTATMYTGPVTISTSETIHALATEAGWSNSTVATAAYTINGALPAPTFTPSAGSYGPAQTVTINLPAGATGCYTSDGSTPAATTAGTCSHGTTVSGTVSVSSTLTLKAISTEATFLNSSVASALYTINGALATPTFSPNGGSFAGPQTVSITCPAGATCWYNFTGTFTSCTPTVCAGATMYSTPVTVSTTSTLSSIATEAGWSNSSVGSAAFTINGTLSAPTLSPGAGVYPTTQTVTVTLPMSATGCYTIDGTTPTATTPGTCAHGATVSGTISITTTTTLKVLATEVAFTNSPVTTALYTIVPPSPCTISSPTASQLIQTPGPLQLQSSCSTAPTATKAIYFIDYQRTVSGYSNPILAPAINDFSTAWCGPFCATWYVGLNGDGAHTIFAKFYQYDTLLATTATVTFTVRLEGQSNQTINHLPTSGTGPFGVLTKGPGAHFMLDGLDGSSSNYFGDPLYSFCGLNGGTSQTGGWIIPNLVTTCWPNGQHLIVAGTNPALGAADPLLETQTFTSGNVSGNQITVTNHPFQNGGAIICTGSCPTPLVAGSQWFWATSATNPSNTVTVSISGGTGTFTCSGSCGVSASTPVYIKNIQYTDQVTGAATCDGLYSAASGSGSSFTLTMPSVCNGKSGTKNLEADVNPSFVQYVDANTITLSATPGGSTITLTSTGSGTMTLSQRASSPYYTVGGFISGEIMGADYVQSGGPANIYQLVTFANSNAPMQLHPNFWEMHLVAGASPTALCNPAQLIQNTDLTFTSTACNASGLTWTEVDDGGVSGVCSVDASGNVTPLSAGWCKVVVPCAACAAGGVTLPTVNVHVQVHTGSVTFPHYTTCGVLATGFTTGTCHSFYPISAWQFNIAQAPGWLGPALTRSNVNSVLDGFSYSTALTLPASVGPCPTWPDATMTTVENFAATWNLNLEYDMYPIWFQEGMDATSLASILNNTGYNRRACLQSLVSHLVSLGRVWRIFNDDEVSNIIGNYLEPAPQIGGPNWTNATTSGGVITFNVANITTLAPFSQTTGNGNAIQITGATTNPCLNGWLLLTTVSSTTLTAPAGSCGNGLTINATSDPSASMNIPFPALTKVGNSLLQNAGPLPANLTQTEQTWGTSLTSIVVASGVGTIHWTGHGIPASNTPAIRLYCYACTDNLLNFIGVPVVTDANTLTITWTGTAGGTAPTDGTYNVSTDPTGFYITVDPNWGPNPLSQFYTLVNAVAGHPLKSFSMLGTLFGSPASTFSYQGNPANVDSSWLYVPQGPPNYLGPDVSVNQSLNYSYSTSGISSRAYQLAPRSMLFAGGYIGGGNIVTYCRSFYFNPGCDRPAMGGLNWRRETQLSQRMGMKAIGVRGGRLYNGYQDTPDAYKDIGLGWNSPGNGGFGTGAGMNPYTAPQTWAGFAETNALLKIREDTELQPECNKLYLGPYFQSDCHVSPTYGNETTVIAADEQPYGTFTVPLNPIAGGSTILYTSDGYSTRVTPIAGNPSSVTQEWAPSPGFTWVYVSQPPGRNVLDQIAFTPPSPLPFGAVKMLVQLGYYPDSMQDDPVTDCTSGCTLSVDHHNINVWYRTIYTDTNYQPLSVSDPTLIPSQGIF